VKVRTLHEDDIRLLDGDRGTTSLAHPADAPLFPAMTGRPVRFYGPEELSSGDSPVMAGSQSLPSA
jgi:hypothetical protein